MLRTTALRMSRTPAMRPAEAMAARGEWFFMAATIIPRASEPVNDRQRHGERIANLSRMGDDPRMSCILAALLFLADAPPPPAAALPPWTEGTLDIHQISTGRGNAALVVF